MKKVIMGVAFAAILGLTSCGVSSHLSHNQNQNQTSVVLNQANFKTVETVSEKVSQKYVFGLGGITKKALRESALSKMTNSADLKGGSKAIINTSVHETVKMITPIYMECTVTANGTIVEFTK